jgi:hypothetical protein
MNKQIRELMLQAGGHANYRAFRGHFLPPWPDYIDPATVDLEKFAELIVRECTDVGSQWAEDLIDTKHYAFVNKKIKQHFGVE